MADQNLPAIPDIKIDAQGRMLPATLQEMWWMAKLFSKEGLCPKAYINKPESILVAWQFGAELGMGKFASLQNIATINGTPAIYGDAQLAVALDSGQVEDVEETFEGEPYISGEKENDNYTAVCTVKTKNGRVVTRKFSVRDAKRAKLWMKRGTQGGDTPWVGYWPRMMQMRARAFALRDAAPGALKGIRVREEIEHETPIEGEQKTFTSKAPETSTVSAASMENVPDEKMDAVVGEPVERFPNNLPEEYQKPAEPGPDAGMVMRDQILGNPGVIELQFQVGISHDEAVEFVTESASANGVDVDAILVNMPINIQSYINAASAYFQRPIMSKGKTPEPEPEPEPGPEPGPEPDPVPEKSSSGDKRFDQGLEDASLIIALGKLSKPEFEAAFKRPKSKEVMDKVLPENKKIIYNMWKKHNLGPCPFYKEEQPQLPIEDPKGNVHQHAGPLPLVPADYPPSPERKYSFALSNARKRHPDVAEEAREECKMGRLVMSEDGAKMWYEKIVEIMNRPSKKDKKNKK
jgi:hypothetical protein